MALTETKTMGTASTPSPEPEKIKWVDLEQAEKLERYIDRRFVKKNDKADSKEYFYKVIDIFAYQPAAQNPDVLPSTDQQLYKFNVQKYYRHKTQKVTKRDSSQNQVTTESEAPVMSHNWGEGGRLLDPWASFPIDTHKFKEQFEADNTEE